jgi:hypothetical protein
MAVRIQSTEEDSEENDADAEQAIEHEAQSYYQMPQSYAYPGQAVPTKYCQQTNNTLEGKLPIKFKLNTKVKLPTKGSMAIRGIANIVLTVVVRRQVTQATGPRHYFSNHPVQQLHY